MFSIYEKLTSFMNNFLSEADVSERIEYHEKQIKDLKLKMIQDPSNNEIRQKIAFHKQAVEKLKSMKEEREMTEGLSKRINPKGITDVVKQQNHNRYGAMIDKIHDDDKEFQQKLNKEGKKRLFTPNEIKHIKTIMTRK